MFDPKTTVPPTTAAIAHIMTVALNPIAPIIIAKIRIPPAPAANFETRIIFPSTLKETMTAMKAAEAHRAELISRLDLRVVGEREVGFR